MTALGTNQMKPHMTQTFSAHDEYQNFDIFEDDDDDA